MSTHPQSTTSGSGHEHRDVDVASIFLVGVALLLGLLVIQLIVWLTLKHLRLHDGESPSSVVRPGTFPQPRLQVDPPADLAAIRARELHDLNSYGWIDRGAGTVQIPIDRAMELLVERGLPDTGQKQTPLNLMQARPAQKPTPSRHHRRY